MKSGSVGSVEQQATMDQQNHRQQSISRTTRRRDQQNRWQQRIGRQQKDQQAAEDQKNRRQQTISMTSGSIPSRDTNNQTSSSIIKL